MIRGKTRPLPVAAKVENPNEIKAKFNASIHNRFDIEVVDAKTGEVKQRAQAENVICNQLWTQLIVSKGDNWSRYIRYGSGAGVPQSSDTTLFSDAGYLDGNSERTYDINVSKKTASLKRKATLPTATAVGVTITEIGLSYSTSANSLCTHAMLKDANGNPISIIKTDTDVVNIYATIYVHLNFDNPDAFVPLYARNDLIKGVLGDGYIICYNLAYTCGFIGQTSNDSIADNNLFSADSVSSSVIYVEDPANKKLTINAPRLALEKANSINGIRSIYFFNDYASFPNIGINALNEVQDIAIAGEPIGTGDGVSTNFATTFSDVLNANIFVDGVKQTSGVTVKPYKLFSNDMGRYFIAIAGNSLPNVRLTSALSNSSSLNTATDKTAVFYNPYFEIGIDSFVKPANILAYISNDITNWFALSESLLSETIAIPADKKTYKYYKFVQKVQENSLIKDFTTSSDLISQNNIIFDTAPAVGSVITADYTTKTIAKDANHVFDFSLTIQFGEYTPI